MRNRKGQYSNKHNRLFAIVLLRKEKKENRNSSHAARAVYQHLVSTQQSFRLLHLMLFSLKQIENLMVAFAAVAYPLLFFSFKLLESYKRNKEITGSSYIIIVLYFRVYSNWMYSHL